MNTLTFENHALFLQKQFIEVTSLSFSLFERRSKPRVSPTIRQFALQTLQHEGAWNSEKKNEALMIDEQAITVRFSDANLNVLNIFR